MTLFALTLAALCVLALNAPSSADPIVIDHGGTWTGGVYDSWDNRTPAVTITTDQPVTLYKCTISGNADLIRAVSGGAHVTIRDCKGVTSFSSIAGRSKGFFFNSYQPTSVVIQNNHIEGTGGINIVGFRYDSGTSDTITIAFNDIKNVDGRKSRGIGRRPDFDTGPDLRHAVMLNSVHAVPKIVVAWNQMVNEPWQSACEDVIDLYQSSGTRGSNVVVNNNYIQGAYPPRPESQKYCGGGINLGDTAPGDKNPADVPAYADCFANQIINTCNYGIGIFGGHDMSLHDNTVLCSGKFGSGYLLKYTFVGSLSWDYAKIGNWHDNSIHGNQVGYEQNNFSHDTYTGQQLNNYWAPTVLRYCSNHSPHLVTQAMESREWTRWQDKVASHQIHIGTNWP